MSLNISTILKTAQETLKKLAITSYQLDAEILLLHVLKLNKIDLITQGNKINISDQQLDQFNLLIKQRCTHKPIAKIIGSKEFYSLDFKVSQDVLDPRSDTEILISVIEKLITNKNNKLKILDIGTGSGAIAISLAKLLPQADLTAVDISKQALKIAKYNATKHLLDKRIAFVKSNIYQNITEKFDLIISNPPYIASKVINELPKEVRLYDPITALDGGEDGLDFYRKIALNSRRFLNDGGKIALEIGYNQKEDVINIFKDYNLILAKKDYGNNDRCLIFSA
jgi:release factor glutamine methyltransferase